MLNQPAIFIAVHFCILCDVIVSSRLFCVLCILNSFSCNGTYLRPEPSPL